MRRYLEYHFIRFDRKILFTVLKLKWFYKYSLFVLLIIECILSFLTTFNFYTWDLYGSLVLAINCSLFLGLREFFSCYLHKKCIWQKTTSIGLIVSALCNLIVPECTNFYVSVFKCFSVSIFLVLSILMYKERLCHKTNE